MPGLRWETYQDDGGLWRWRALAGNGKIVADSREAYASERNARRALGSFRLAARERAAPDVEQRPPLPRCACPKPSLSKAVSSLCTTCGRIRG